MKKIFIWSAWWAEHSQTSYQSTIVYGFFVKNWYILVNEAKDSDIILLNGYPFDNYEEKIALLSINYYMKKYPGKEIIVFWSIPDMIFNIRSIVAITFISYSEYQKFDELFMKEVSIFDINIGRIRFFIPLTFEWISLGDLAHNHLWENINVESKYEITEFDLKITVNDLQKETYPIDLIEEYPGKYNYILDSIENYYIETTRWCWFRCSYCAIQRVSWFTKSFSLDLIINNIKKWLLEWAKNIILIDEDCWSYGIDIWLDFAFLINTINRIDWDFNIKLYYLEPSCLEKNYAKIEKSFWINRISYVRVTLQTTSPRILKLMNRKYDIERILEISSELRGLNPKIFLWAIVIYWFPTETMEEFKDYFRLLKYYDCIDFLCYAEKQWTKSYNMKKNSYEEILRKSYVILKMKDKYRDKIDPVTDSPWEQQKRLKTCY